jgi:hypothetical protein
MSDPDNFLTRWSRRKRENEAKPAKDDGAGSKQAALTENADEKPVASVKAAPAEPEFDVDKLPPLESIGADTDISAFMQKGVPSALRHAALRRAWSADPAIRNFIGPNENYWDAAGPEGIPGFGDLDPTLDVKRMVAELFGEAPAESAKADLPSSPMPEKEISAGAEDERSSSPSPVGTDNSLVHRTEDVASQNSDEPAEPEKRLVRRHGGAMPE